MTGVTLDNNIADVVFHHVNREKERMEFLGDRVGYLGGVLALLDAGDAASKRLLTERMKLLGANNVYAAHLVRHGLHRLIYGELLDKLNTKAGAPERKAEYFRPQDVASDTYEAFLAALYLIDPQAAIKFAYDDAVYLIARQREPLDVVIKKYLDQYTPTTTKRKNKDFNPAELPADFIADAEVLRPALELHSARKKELSDLGNAVVALVTAERLYRSTLRTPHDFDNAMKVLMTAPVGAAHVRRLGLDESIWGSDNEIKQKSVANLRETYDATIGAYYALTPERAFSIANKHLDAIVRDGESFTKAGRDYANKYANVLLRDFDYTSMFAQLVTRLAGRAERNGVRLISATPIYVESEERTPDDKYEFTLLIPTGFNLPAGSNKMQDSRLARAAYFSAKGYGTTKKSAQEDAAKTLGVWMKNRGLVQIDGDKFKVEPEVYTQSLRNVYADPSIRYVFTGVEGAQTNGVDLIVGSYEAAPAS